MKRVEVRYGRGRDLLDAYWGFLANGGIVLDRDEGLAEGQSVSVNVCIEATESAHELTGRVVRRASGRGRTVIAFDGSANSELLRAALDQNPVDLDAGVRVVDANGGQATARISNISRDGCTVCVDGAGLEVGSNVIVRTAELEVAGCVVWAMNHERGIMFDDAAEIGAYL